MEPFLVLADWLQARGDPWGDVMRAFCTDQKVATVLRAHGEHVCFLHGRASLTWSRGFVTRLERMPCADGFGFPRDMERLTATAACRQLQVLSFTETLDDQTAMVLVAHGGRLRHMREVLDCNLSPNVAAELRALWPKVTLGPPIEKPRRVMMMNRAPR